MPPVDRVSEAQNVMCQELNAALFEDSYKKIARCSVKQESDSLNVNFLDFDPAPKDEVIKRKDGGVLTVKRSADGELVSVDLGDDVTFTKSADGKSWKSNLPFPQELKILDVKVTVDGSLTFEAETSDKTRKCSIQMGSDGSVTSKLTQDGINSESTKRPDGSEIFTSKHGTFDKRADGKIEIKPVNGGNIVVDLNKGTMEVTFPDGFKKTYNDLSERERKTLTNGEGAEITWKSQSPDFYMFKGQDPKDIHRWNWSIKYREPN